MSPDTALHAYTPLLHALAPRGELARRVAYCRGDSTSPPVARIERIERNAAGHVRSVWDARLSLPILRVTPSLTGAPLGTRHADAGWRIRLFESGLLPGFEWNEGGVARHIRYDSQRRMLEIHEGVDVSRCLERFAYGSNPAAGTAGRLIRHDDAAGRAEFGGYGVSGNALVESRRFLLSMAPPDWPVDEPGRDALVESHALTTRWRHDAFGHAYLQVDAGGHERRHALDIAGRVSSVYVTVLGGKEQAVCSDIDYDAQDHVVVRHDGSVKTTARFCEGDGRQVGVRRETAVHVLQDLVYAYDGVGNVLSIEDMAVPTAWFEPGETDPIQRYAYDTLDQLIQASGRESVLLDGAIERPPPLLPGASADHRLRDYEERYAYDAGGNLLQLTHMAAGADYVREFAVPPDSNRSVLVETGYVPTFDGCGHLMELKRGVPLSWDTRGYLARCGTAGGDHEQFHYDGNGARLRKRSADGELRYLHGWERRSMDDGSEPWDVLHISQAETAVRIVCLKGAVAPVLRIQVADILHSVTLETTEAGDVLTEEGFHPYGGTSRWAARDLADASQKARRYGGHESDVSELSYIGHRYYAPWLGRWLSPDPAGDVDGLNRYRYARNNPGSGFDPDGLMVRRQSGRGWNPVDRLIVGHKVRKHLENAVATGRESVAHQLGVASGADRVPVDLDRALNTSRVTIQRAADVLRADPDHARRLVTSFLGVPHLADARWQQTREALSSGFAHIDSDLEDLMGAGGSRLVLVHYPEKPHATKRKPNAFVYSGDPDRRVFINRANVQRIGITPLPHTLIHELSHQLPGALKTFDVLYAGERQLADEATQFRPPRTFNALSITGTHRAATSIGWSYLGMAADERKAGLMMRNADTWAAIAMGLAREHADN